MSVVDTLCKLPSTDVNYISALNSATKAQLQLAVKIMEMNKSGHNQSRIDACNRKIKTFDTEKKPDTSKKVADKTKSVTKSTAKKDTKPKEIKIVSFPGEKPKIKELPKSAEAHTYDECEKKITSQTEKYKDADNQYVIKGILEKCKEDADFRNNVMRKDKTYDGFYTYMFNAAMNGYCVKVGSQGGMLTKEKALDLAYDYFNMSEIIKPEEKKKVAQKLTKEVNKIAEEVNAEVKETTNTVSIEDKVKEIAEEKNGQLKFNF